MHSDFDRRFNCVTVGTTRVLVNNTAERLPLEEVHEGRIQCKLVHARFDGLEMSFIIPDLLFVDSDTPYFIQPLHFMPPRLVKTESEICARLWVDISHSQTLQIDFSNLRLISTGADGSEMFHCQVRAPKDLYQYRTGGVKDAADGTPLVQLFHHTTAGAKESILCDSHFTGSRWNIAGTNSLKKVHYVYLSALPLIELEEDLRMINMASDGTIEFICDDYPVPTIRHESADDAALGILNLTVYREDTLNRTATLPLWVRPETLAPHHLIRHAPAGVPVWYEVAGPFAYRVGLEPGTVWFFDRDRMEGNPDAGRHFMYVIVGDGRTLKGLAAPYDEENTSEIAKIQRSGPSGNILDYWFDHGNQSLFDALKVETQE